MSAMLSSAPASSGERWPPLESSPDVFNQFMWSLGVPQGEAELHDLYGLDADAMAMVPQPAIAVIFCFPDSPQNPRSPLDQVLATEEKLCRGRVRTRYDCTTLMRSNESIKAPFIEKIRNSGSGVFHKADESLGNACGTIALLHAFINAYPEIGFLENSCLDIFFNSSASMDPYERARFLEKDNNMARAHSLAASAGDTEICDVVEEHYVCFMALNGILYELDGMKHGPVKHGSTSPETLLQDAVHIITAIVHSIPNSMNFNVMVLSRKCEVMPC